MNSNTIKNIPSVILSMIAAYLSVKEIKQFRLVCHMFYDATFCKQVLKKFKVKCRTPNNIYSNFLRGFSGGKFLTLSMLSVTENSLNKILDVVPNIQNLVFNIKYLHHLKNRCSSLISLTLVDDKSCLLHQMKHCDLDTFFRPTLSTLNLKNLTFKSCGLSYHSELIQVLICSSKTIQEFGLECTTINNTKNYRVFKEFILSCRNITSWNFHNVHIVKRGVLLPFTTKQYTCMDSVLSLINNQHSNLQSFTLASLIPYVDKVWKKNNFKELQYLELHSCFFYFNEMPNCAKLTTLKLMKCHLPFYHLMKLSFSVRDRLQKLTVQSYKEFDDEKILKVIDAFVKLREITIMNMRMVTPKILEKINHSDLKFFSIENCYNFNKKAVRENIQLIRADLKFTVVFNDMVNGVPISLF